MKITGRRSKLLLALLSICFLCALSCESGSQSMKGLLPDADDVMGWRKDGERLIYLPENLWEHINGAAEGFLVYEFEKVVVQDYLSINDTGLKVEIYKHASPLMAFGIYSQFRGPGLTYVDVGTEGFGDEYSLQFFQGSFKGYFFLGHFRLISAKSIEQGRTTLLRFLPLFWGEFQQLRI